MEGDGEPERAPDGDVVVPAVLGQRSRRRSRVPGLRSRSERGGSSAAAASHAIGQPGGLAAVTEPHRGSGRLGRNRDPEARGDGAGAGSPAGRRKGRAAGSVGDLDRTAIKKTEIPVQEKPSLTLSGRCRRTLRLPEPGR